MTITSVNTLKDRLIYARELRGLTQGQLARACKCSQGTIGNVESGVRQSLKNIVVVARKLKVSADWLYDGKGPAPEDENGLCYRAGSLVSDNVNTLQFRERDAWTLDAIGILSKLDESQKAAAVARLREFVSYLAPPQDGQALQVAGK